LLKHRNCTFVCWRTFSEECQYYPNLEFFVFVTSRNSTISHHNTNRKIVSKWAKNRSIQIRNIKSVESMPGNLYFRKWKLPLVALESSIYLQCYLLCWVHYFLNINSKCPFVCSFRHVTVVIPLCQYTSGGYDKIIEINGL